VATFSHKGRRKKALNSSLRGALATTQSTLVPSRAGLLRGACHRARIRATRWLAMTWRQEFGSVPSPSDLPDGLSAKKPVQSHLRKYFASRVGQITSTTPAVSSLRGALAIVTDAGRDAVDADSALDESCLRWTTKSCGPDAPTLVSR
jgi:hypothetical protein